VRNRTRQQSQQRHAAWQEWNRALANDPRIAVRYDFESEGPTLTDTGSTQTHGLIIGAERTNGRWAEKGALEFKRPSDRVRVNIPGSYDALTFTAWIRVDAMPERHMALLLTDGFEVAQPHWQIAPTGDLRLGLRIPSESRKRETTNYGAPDVITPGRIGVWCFVATVYDRQSGRVKHYLNGRQVASAAIRFDQPLTIGSAEIGNWGVTLGKGTHPVRNFVGRMDEFTLWKVALTAEEILNIHRSTHP
jgi:Concanavalin A-like lectin/glucanases superfamily